MRRIIEEKLNEIEQSEQVKILYCAEAGSRAWGFASPDSDYDVRFVYVRPREFYLRLDKTRDVIDWQLDDTLDIVGWDVQKTLSLLHRSNPSLFEWYGSPIVYRTSAAWEGLAPLFSQCFVPKDALHHYLNMAKNNAVTAGDGERVRLKKYFYILRPLFACRWILADGTPPPVPFAVLAERFLTDEIREEVQELLARKAESSELGEAARRPLLDAYIRRAMEEIERAVAGMPKREGQGWDALNAAFLSLTAKE